MIAGWCCRFLRGMILWISILCRLAFRILHILRAAGDAAKPIRIGRLTNVWNQQEAGLESAVDAALKVLEKNGATLRMWRCRIGPYEEAAELTILMESASAFQESDCFGPLRGID